MSFLTDLETAIFRPKRSLGAIEAQVTIEESHTDELVITDHPIEQGANVTDHAYKRPAEVTVRCGWSNSGTQSIAQEVDSFLSLLEGNGLGAAGYVQSIYAQLLTLQESRIPFDIVTGKRKYRNMLIRSISASTDEKSEHSLFVTVVCREIITVQTYIVLVPAREVQQFPQQTAQTENLGTKQPIKQPSNSALYNLLGG